MSKPTVARRDEYRHHPVMLPLSKAHAAVTLADVCADGSDYLQISGPREPEDQDWIQGIAFDAIRDALAEAEAEFRKSLTPEQALARVIGGPKAVA